MKRSEMLKLMSKAYGKKNYIYFCEEDADSVLTAMEAAGMKPPTYTKIMTTSYENDEGEKVQVPFEQSQNMWEPEDEG